MSTALNYWATIHYAGTEDGNGDFIVIYKPTLATLLSLTKGGNLTILGSISVTVNMNPAVDNTSTLGTSALRWKSASSILFNVFHAVSDANPTAQLADGVLNFGSGGAAALGVALAYESFDYTGFLASPIPTNTRIRFYVAPTGSAVNNAFALCRVSDQANPERVVLSSDNISANEFELGTVVGGSGTNRPFMFHSNGAEAFRITITPVLIASVPVQIGGSTSGAQANQISTGSLGAATTALYIGNAQITTVSDRRLKTEIAPTVLNALPIIESLPVIRFKWNDPSDTAPVNKNTRGVWEFGGIAQDWIKSVPWLVNAPDRDCPVCLAGQKCDEHEGVWQIEYEYAVPLLVQGIKELEARVKALESR